MRENSHVEAWKSKVCQDYKFEISRRLPPTHLYMLVLTRV